jgi:hypothetical protein
MAGTTRCVATVRFEVDVDTSDPTTPDDLQIDFYRDEAEANVIGALENVSLESGSQFDNATITVEVVPA